MASKITPRLSAVTQILADQYAPLERKSEWYCDDLLCDGKPHKGWPQKHCRETQRPPDNDDWFIWLLMSGRGFGKMLALDTPVPTPAGWTTMADIAVGDVVFDETGNQCSVTQVFNIETPESAFRVRFSDHTSIDACSEHEWVTWEYRDRRTYERYLGEEGPFSLPKNWVQWRSAKGLGPTVKTTQEISQTLHHPNALNHAIPLAGPLDLANQELLIDPYVLGAWLGDGSHKSGVLSGIDPEILERVESAGFSVSHNPNCRDEHYISGLRPLLRQLGVFGNKHIPAAYLRASVDQRTALLQGLMDTDGYVDPRRGDVVFTNCNRRLIDGVTELARSLGERPYVGAYQEPKSPNHSQAWRVMWHPVAVIPVWLTRKRDNLRPLGTRPGMIDITRKIIAVDPIDPVPMRCIAVDSPNHMYLAGEAMVPTHNSRTAAEWLLREASRYPRTEWAVVAPTGMDTAKCFNDLRVGINSIGKYQQPGAIVVKYNQTLHDATLSNGAIIHGVSADRPDRLRGYNLAGAWCDELSSWRYPDSWNLGLLPALRDDSVTPRVVVTTTPKPVTLLRQLVDEEQLGPNGERLGSTIVTHGSTFDNADNLAPKFLEEMETRYAGTRRGRQELYGELLTDVDGALVSQDMIDDARLDELPGIVMLRTIVAVDPATTSGEDSDETGIIVCAQGIDNRGYVLADLSCKLSPDGWAKVVAKAYEEYRCDRVVAEKNQGGDMVERIIRSVHPNIAYTGVVAKVGKKIRAEPVAALYEQGKISHIGYFTKLEDQLCTWIPDLATHQKSPDRVDALVHGITELGLIGLPGVHIASWMEMTHPSCQVCSQPAPKGTPICPKCGAQRTVDPEPEVTDVAPDPWSIIGYGPTTVQPNPHTQAVMDTLKSIQGPEKWWDRRR